MTQHTHSATPRTEPLARPDCLLLCGSSLEGRVRCTEKGYSIALVQSCWVKLAVALVEVVMAVTMVVVVMVLVVMVMVVKRLNMPRLAIR